MCRDYGSEMSEGTLEPFIDETNQWRRCTFTITAPAGNQIQLSCSTVSNYPTDVTSYLGVSKPFRHIFVLIQRHVNKFDIRFILSPMWTLYLLY